MSDKKSEVSLEDIVSLCKRRGFIFQGSEIYGGLAGTWDYGPLGVQLKKNLMDLWWKTFVETRDDMVGLDAAILMNPRTWKASGHVDTFTDPLIECKKCNARYRTDKIVGSKYEDFVSNLSEGLLEINNKIESGLDEAEELFKYYDLFPQNEILNQTREIINNSKDNIKIKSLVVQDVIDAPKFLGLAPKLYLNINNQKCEQCGNVDWGESRSYNLMFETTAGPVASNDSNVYIRPETAQGIFTNFKNVVDTLYPDIPFGIAQVGKAFRNEISPRDFVFRSREFNQMEIEYFIHESQWEELFEEWRGDIKEFLEKAGVDATKIHELDVPTEDLAHYSKRTIDYEFEYPHGKDELLGLAYRTDFDLRNVERESGKKMDYRPKDGSEPFVPHVIEPSFGVERLFMAVMVSAFKKDVQNGEERIYLALPEHIAPVKYCVSPLLKNKPELVSEAREVYFRLRRNNAVMWDDNGNIGKRYRRQDEIGTPYCIVIDFQTLEDGTVTIRDRDTTEQKRIAIEELLA